MVKITEGELFALVVAEKAVQQYRGTNFEKPLLSALQKLAQALPDTFSLHLADWDRTISFRTSAEPVLNLEVFDTLARATAQRRQLEIVYRKPGRAACETRVIDPYHLANINGEWYLFAFDHLRQDVRTFVPARIQSVRRHGPGLPAPGRVLGGRSAAGQFRRPFGRRPVRRGAALLAEGGGLHPGEALARLAGAAGPCGTAGWSCG